MDDVKAILQDVLWFLSWPGKQWPGETASVLREKINAYLEEQARLKPV